MTLKVLMAVGDASLAAELQALMDEAGVVVAAEVTVTGDVIPSVERIDADIVLLHEALGPDAAFDVIRALTLRAPHVAVVLAVRDATAEVLNAAVLAGARSILPLPTSLGDLQPRLEQAATWTRQMRAATQQAPVVPGGGSGRVVTLMGAKGGVGTTTVAVHLALAAASTRTASRVCLVDLDLQAGDVGSAMRITHRRSITDLVDVADELSTRSIEEVLFSHRSGLRVLLAPEQGERGDAISGAAVRRIIAALKAAFDVVVIDCGSVLTDANAAAIELADVTLRIVTPDGACISAARRQSGLLHRLMVQKEEDAVVLITRSSRANEVQPDYVRRLIGCRTTLSVLPAAFRALEPYVNSGDPDRVVVGPWTRAVAELAGELGVVPLSTPGPAPSRGTRRRRGRGEDGQVAVETIGAFFLLGLLLLGIWQGALVIYTHNLADQAAVRASRRVAVHDAGDAGSAATAILPQAWQCDGCVQVTSGPDSAVVTLSVPIIVPGLGSPLHVTARAGTQVEP